MRMTPGLLLVLAVSGATPPVLAALLLGHARAAAIAWACAHQPGRHRKAVTR